MNPLDKWIENIQFDNSALETSKSRFLNKIADFNPNESKKYLDIVNTGFPED